jgi:hypothetical protein
MKQGTVSVRVGLSYDPLRFSPCFHDLLIARILPCWERIGIPFLDLQWTVYPSPLSDHKWSPPPVERQPLPCALFPQGKSRIPSRLGKIPQGNPKSRFENRKDPTPRVDSTPVGSDKRCRVLFFPHVPKSKNDRGRVQGPESSSPLTTTWF